MHQICRPMKRVASFRLTEFAVYVHLMHLVPQSKPFKSFSSTYPSLSWPRLNLDSVLLNLLTPFIEHDHAERVVVIPIHQLTIVVFIQR